MNRPVAPVRGSPESTEPVPSLHPKSKKMAPRKRREHSSGTLLRDPMRTTPLQRPSSSCRRRTPEERLVPGIVRVGLVDPAAHEVGGFGLRLQN